jgi:uncharacterized RDD family membrane protein YckC
MTWYYAQGGEQLGPVEDLDFQQLVDTGLIQPATLVWRPDQAEWMEYGQLMAGSTGWAACAECGVNHPDQELLMYAGQPICPACKPVFVQKIREGLRLSWIMEYATFWVRFGAKFIDNLIMTVINYLLLFILGAAGAAMGLLQAEMAFFFLQGAQILLSFGLSALYTTLMIGRYQATVGKMALKIKVVRPDGERVGYWRAFARYWAEMLSGMTMGIGYFIAAFDEERRSLHDHLCSTRVVVR